jgi:hypothetical protein
MVINIGLANLDLADIRGLANRLADIIEPASIWFEGSRDNVSVHAEVQSENAINSVIDTVQNWLAVQGAASAALSIGQRSYTLIGQGQTASTL